MRTTGILLSMLLVKSEQLPPDKRQINFDQVAHHIKLDEPEVAAGVGKRMGANDKGTAGVKNRLGFVGDYFDDDEVFENENDEVASELSKDIPDHCGKCEVVMEVILSDFANKSQASVEQLKEAIKTVRMTETSWG